MRCDLFSNRGVLGVLRMPTVVNSTARTDYEKVGRSDQILYKPWSLNVCR